MEFIHEIRSVETAYCYSRWVVENNHSKYYGYCKGCLDY